MSKKVSVDVGSLKASAVELRENGRHDLEGYEHLDDTPVAVPLNFQNIDPVVQSVVNVLASRELARRLDAEGFETEEEANDFEVEGDRPIPTPFEIAGDERFDVLVRAAKLREAKAALLAKSKEGGNNGKSAEHIKDDSTGNRGRSDDPRSVGGGDKGIDKQIVTGGAAPAPDAPASAL